jgi:hypothetical protein
MTARTEVDNDETRLFTLHCKAREPGEKLGSFFQAEKSSQ